MPAGRSGCSPLAGRPLTAAQLAAIAAAFEVETSRPAPRSVTGPRRGDGVLDADLRAGLDEALEHGFLVERDGAIAFRHESIGRAVERDLLPMTRARHHAALATGIGGPAVGRRPTLARGPRPARGAGRGDRGGRPRRPSGTPRPTSSPRSSSPWRSPTDSATGRGPADGPTGRSGDRVEPPGPGRRGRLRGRPDGSRATAYLEAAIGGLDARRRSGPPRAAPRAAGRRPPGGGRPGRGDDRRTTSRRARPARTDAGARHGPRLARPADDARRHLLRRPAARPRGDRGRPRLRAGRPASRRSTPRRRSAVALAWGSDPSAAIELLREAERAAREPRRPRRAVPDPGEPDDRARPGRPAGRGRRRRLRRASRRPVGPASRRSTATSSPATSPNRCSCSAAGPRRAS